MGQWKLTLLSLHPTLLQDLSQQFAAAAVDDSAEMPGAAPPEVLSKAAVDKRLRRIMQLRSDGTSKVPQEFRDQWKDPLQRESILAMFEKCGYNPDWLPNDKYIFVSVENCFMFWWMCRQLEQLLLFDEA